MIKTKNLLLPRRHWSCNCRILAKF